ncbi:hypothetical protein [Blastococcus sp. SYSU DS0619]
MRARTPAQARFLGLWTAGWLAALLVAGMVRFGDPAVQWPVLAVPALWALVALRPRRPSRPSWDQRYEGDRAREEEWADEDEWVDEEEWAGEEEWAADGRSADAWDDPAWEDEARGAPAPGERTDTVERPALRRRTDGTGERW